MPPGKDLGSRTPHTSVISLDTATSTVFTPILPTQLQPCPLWGSPWAQKKKTQLISHPRGGSKQMAFFSTLVLNSGNEKHIRDS